MVVVGRRPSPKNSTFAISKNPAFWHEARTILSSSLYARDVKVGGKFTSFRALYPHEHCIQNNCSG